jgi:DNA-directed RNA polymerase subunit RPC12/RpoP
MILDPKESTVIYRCPKCGTHVKGLAGLFSLHADMLKLKCPCGQSEMTLQYTRDKKVRLTVPCIVCPSPHNFVVSSDIFFSRELFAMECPYSGIDICFCGEDKAVSEAMEESDREILEMTGGETMDRFTDQEQNDEMFSDPQILDIVNFVINDLAEEGGITCRCADGCKSGYKVEIGDSVVRVSCPDCGASADVPAGSMLSAEAFLTCDHLTLK